MKNGSGYAFSRSEGKDCPFHTIDNLCTPFIEHVSYYFLYIIVPGMKFVQKILLNFEKEIVHDHFLKKVTAVSQ